jgi:hypothetical protein
MTKRIVALDPGGTTGWATWTDGPQEEWSWGQIGPQEHHKELNDFLGLQQTQDFILVCETFDFRQHDNNRTKVNLISREYIGVAKLFAAERMSTPVVLQTPAQAKTFVTDEKLKAMDLWVPGKVHARDALRHLITYMVRVQRRYDLVESWKDL